MAPLPICQITARGGPPKEWRALTFGLRHKWNGGTASYCWLLNTQGMRKCFPGNTVCSCILRCVQERLRAVSIGEAADIHQKSALGLSDVSTTGRSKDKEDRAGRTRCPSEDSRASDLIFADRRFAIALGVGRTERTYETV